MTATKFTNNKVSGNVADDHKRTYFAFLFLCIILVTIVGLLLFIRFSCEWTYASRRNQPPILRRSDNINDTPDLVKQELKIVNRSEWKAVPYTQSTTLQTPVPYVIIFHTTTRNCSDQAGCCQIVRIIQTQQQAVRGWWDIGFSFLVGGDGQAYEGRGWNRQGAFIPRYNDRAIGIAFIGNFDRYPPAEKEIVAAQQLIAKGVEEGYISENYKLFGQKQLVATATPGKYLYDVITTWPHWSRIV